MADSWRERRNQQCAVPTIVARAGCALICILIGYPTLNQADADSAIGIPSPREAPEPFPSPPRPRRSGPDGTGQMSCCLGWAFRVREAGFRKGGMQFQRGFLMLCSSVLYMPFQYCNDMWKMTPELHHINHYLFLWGCHAIFI